MIDLVKELEEARAKITECCLAMFDAGGLHAATLMERDEARGERDRLRGALRLMLSPHAATNGSREAALKALVDDVLEEEA